MHEWIVHCSCGWALKMLSITSFNNSPRQHNTSRYVLPMCRTISTCLYCLQDCRGLKRWNGSSYHSWVQRFPSIWSKAPICCVIMSSWCHAVIADWAVTERETQSVTLSGWRNAEKAVRKTWRWYGVLRIQIPMSQHHQLANKAKQGVITDHGHGAIWTDILHLILLLSSLFGNWARLIRPDMG